MVKRYAKIAEADIAVAQKKFSPVVGWDLQYPIVDQKGRKNSTKKGNTKRKTEKAAPAPKDMSSNRPSKTQDSRLTEKPAQNPTPRSPAQPRQPIVPPQATVNKRRYNPFCPQGRAG